MNTASAQLTNINGPAGSGQFGFSVTILANGNFVVTDPGFDDGAIPDVGAVYLYNGATYALISALKGSSPNDSIGLNGVLALGNGNFIVISQKWDNGTATNAGAVTFGNGTTGVSGIVSSSNSLVGGSVNDNVGSGGVIDPIILSGGRRSGNYIVKSPLWDNGAAANAGAITWGNGNTGISGVLSSSNSLVGSSANDNVGAINISSFGVLSTSLALRSPDWDNGAAVNAGAVTWFNGTTGITGVISSSNSLVGTSANDKVGNNAITVLSNGNYVVRNPDWDNGATADAGAVTWGNGLTGITGVVSSSNSLVGSAAGNNVGSGSVFALSNGNYVVTSPLWDNGVATNAGAVTWGNGASGISGVVNSANSLIGSMQGDSVGFMGVTEVGNSNYVVRSPYWHNGSIVKAGAVTWGNGVTGITGAVSSINSLVGSTADDRVGGDDGTIYVLTNGNYVVRSQYWDNGAIVNAGAATWGNGSTGITGTISSSNSLVGNSSNDFVSISGVNVLTNGNYVVRSANWANGASANAGAATWGDGNTGITGTISSSNSLVGTSANDAVGTMFLILSNGNYVVGSPFWNNGAVPQVGAFTWGDGTAGTNGAVSFSNSMIGSSANDFVGISLSSLGNGNYLATTTSWDNGSATGAGAVTWANGSGPVTGVVSSSNSLVGTSANDNIGANTFISSAGNYVVRSINWDNGAATDAGAVTVGNGTTGVAGVVSSSNSIVGSHINDKIGSSGVLPVGNNVVIASPLWDNGALADAGAVTWVNPSGVTGGVVNSNNSLVGSIAGDSVGNNTGVSISNTFFYIIRSTNWDNGVTINAGAATLGNGSTGITGFITSCNSVPGLVTNGGSSFVAAYNNVYQYMVAGKPAENMVVIYNPSGMTCGINHDSALVTINGTTSIPFITNSGCRIIASVTPNGVNPVSDTVRAKVWVEPSLPVSGDSSFAARHYEIIPSGNIDSATARITFYFLQQEFNNFNAINTAKMPTGPGDTAGKARLRIVKYGGISNDGSGLPYSYSGTTTIINPPDSSIIWNTALNRWEVTADVSGFGGFTLGTSNALRFSLCPSATSISAEVTGTTYQWQANTGGGYFNLSNGGFYNGTNTPTLTITGLPTSSSGNKYRCVVDGIPGSEYPVRFEAVWLGNINTDWFTGNNWSGCGNVPDQYTDIIIPGGRANYPVINTNTSVGSLIVASGSNITIQPGIILTIRK